MQLPNTKTEIIFVAIRDIPIGNCQGLEDVTPSLTIMCPTPTTKNQFLPRPRKMPQHLGDGSSGRVYTCPKDKYCHANFGWLVDRRQTGILMHLLLDASKWKTCSNLR